MKQWQYDRFFVYLYIQNIIVQAFMKAEKLMSPIEEKEWNIHPYYRRELAMAYAPDLAPESAVNRLSQWFKFNKQLAEELRRHGYRPRQQVFTSAQVEIIFRYLGKP